MKQEDASDYIDKRLKQMRKHYNALLKDFDLDEIHEFRLAYKKMRAFNRLKNAGLPKDVQIKIGSKIKAIYQATGLIRNHQLHETRMHDLAKDLMVPIPGEYIANLENEKQKLKTDVKAKSRLIVFKQFQLKMQDGTNQSINETSIKNFIVQKQFELIQILAITSFTDNDFHSVRKMLKDILYNYSWVNGNGHQIGRGSLSDIKNVESLTVKLGDFHDLCIAIDFLNPNSISYVEDGEEKKVLFFIKQQLEWSKQNLKETICRDLMNIKKEMIVVQAEKNTALV